MATYKEIVTKAIVGKGKKHFSNSYSVTLDEKATTVLGCWVINHKFEGYKIGEKIGVRGSFDVNIWYSYDNDTKTNVINKTINYDELLAVTIKSEADLSAETDIIVRPLTQPTCSKTDIAEKQITFDIDKELGVEVVGETKIKISIEADEDPWEEIMDEIEEKDMEEIDKVEENYINTDE